jgi:ribosomal protein S18 acetylase RimI-like enzyme
MGVISLTGMTKNSMRSNFLRKADSAWTTVDEVRPGDLWMRPGGVFKVDRVMREGDEVLVFGPSGLARRMDPNDEVAVQRKTGKYAGIKSAAYSAQAIGKAVKRWCHSDQSFDVLAGMSGGAQEGGWGDGGCWVLADAIVQGFGGELYAVRAHDIKGSERQGGDAIDHVLVAMGGGYIDQDGFISEKEFLQHWENAERRKVTAIVPLQGDVLSEAKASVIPKPEKQEEIIAGITRVLEESQRKQASSGITYRTEVTGHHHGQCDGYISAKKLVDGKEIQVGYVDWSEYHRKVHIRMIEVLPEYRRQGVGRGLMEAMKVEFPDQQIIEGSTTDDGTKFFGALKGKKVATGTLFHCAPSRIRSSIQQHGIDPTKFEGYRSTEGTHNAGYNPANLDAGENNFADSRQGVRENVEDFIFTEDSIDIPRY